MCVSSSVFTGRGVKLHTQLHLVQNVKISPFMQFWLDKEDFNCNLLNYTSCCVFVRHTVVILVYGIRASSIMYLKVEAVGLFRKSTNFSQTDKY